MPLTLIEKIFALREVPYFRGLHESELAAVAGAGRERTFRPDEEVCRRGQVLERVYAVIGGGVTTRAGKRVGGLIGTGCLLYRLPVVWPLVAGPDGASCLVFQKSQFFTIVHQCPSLLCAVMQEDLPEGCLR